MAKYSDIKGFTVQTLSTDTVASQVIGGSWSSGGAMNTARNSLAGSGASADNALAFGGSPPGTLAITETYNGSSWTEVADLNTGRAALAGSGVSNTASLAFGGNTPPVLTSGNTKAETENWNGSSWTEVADLNTSRWHLRGCGTNTAALSVGGGAAAPPLAEVANVESWNGSSWTEVSDVSSARRQVGLFGTNTAAISASGYAPPGTVTLVESWNGSSWTEIAEMNTSRYGGGNSGTQTLGLVAGGATPNKTNTEFWNGTSWTEVNDLSTAVVNMGYAQLSATSTSLFGGSAPSSTAATEEWTAPSDFNQIQEGQLFFNSTTNTFKETITDISAGSWASGANINTAREGTSGAGDSAEAALLIGGYTTSAPTVRVANTESWDGSSWTEVNDLNQARYVLQSVGTSTAALAFGGDTPPNTGKTESWNGSSWTETTDLNTARANLGGTGPYTSALAVGGYTSTYVGNTETWDGSSWTEVNDLNEARGLQSSVGVTQTASLAVTGDFPQATNVEQWDGSSWTEIAEVNTARYNSSGNGSATLGLIFGGRIFPGTPPAAYSALTESWNGTAWTERADLATARGDGASAQNISNSSKALYFSGSNPPYVYTEEWTAPLANKTITAS